MEYNMNITANLDVVDEHDDSTETVNLNSDSVHVETDIDVGVDNEILSSSTDTDANPFVGGSECSEYEDIDTIQNKIARRLSEGSILQSLDEAYLLYCEYARLLGFSVKRGTQAYFLKTDIVRMKMFFCSSEGRTDNRASLDKIARYKKQHTRTECRARLRVVRELEGPWTVALFETEHNHELLGPDDSYLLRSSRTLNLAKRSILETFHDSGIGVSQAFRYLQTQCRGPQNVGFMKKDAYDHINRTRRVSRLGNADADALMQYFQDKSVRETNFFWRVLLDDDGRIMNVFWRDGRCAFDYATFGDVVSVDTTFRTNKYNLICAPFVGINHHRSTVMFGIGFLSDESSKSFEWLFSVFLESMGMKEPSVIFSDQDQALKNGIDFVFQNTSHRLCQWHINKNAPAHFGKLNNIPQFKEMWYKCMNGCQSEDEFDDTWNSMTNLYDLQNNRWFNAMYAIRKKWSDVFTLDRFTGGLRATSRSELTNKIIKDMCAASTSLTEFVSFFERIITEWRVREREEDALCRGMPGQLINGNCLLHQAAQVYTRGMYKIFENEAMMSINVDILKSPDNMNESTLVYHVISSGSKTKREIKYNILADEVSCSCAKLTTEGMFCKHILKVFYTLSVTSLPQKYILKRWTKEAKADAPMDNFKCIGSTPPGSEEMIFVDNLMRRVYSLALQCKDKEESRAIVMASLSDLENRLGGCMDDINHKATKGRVGPIEGVANPPAPDHRWLPPKKMPDSISQGKRRRANTKQKGKKANSTRVKVEQP